MTDLIVFTFQDQQMRTFLRDDGEACFVAPDLCRQLNHSNVTKALLSLDDDQKGLTEVQTLGGIQTVNYVTESGMWMLVFRSNKPQARELRQLLSRKVLPALRKHGTYSLPGCEPPPLQSIDYDPFRVTAFVGAVREARRLYGPVAARRVWVELGLPPVVPDSEAVLDTDPFAVPLLAYLGDRAETTIQQAAEGMGIAAPDHSTRYRIGKLLALWGWTPRNKKIDRYKTARVFSRPAPSSSDPMTIAQEPAT